MNGTNSSLFDANKSTGTTSYSIFNQNVLTKKLWWAQVIINFPLGFRLRLKNICALPLYLNVTGPGWGEETQIKFDKNPLWSTFLSTTPLTKELKKFCPKWICAGYIPRLQSLRPENPPRKLWRYDNRNPTLQNDFLALAEQWRYIRPSWGPHQSTAWNKQREQHEESLA